MKEKVLTGYPSVDKPWLKYYKNIEDDYRQEGLYKYLAKSNQDNLESIALMYFGRKITFKQMFKLIDNLSEVFISEGIQPQDKVILLGLNTPDIICSIYALNKIGAIVCIEYVSQKEVSLGNIAKQYGAKWAIVLDVFIEKYKDVLLESGVKKIFVSGLADSMSMHLKTLYRLKQRNRSRNLSSQIRELYTLISKIHDDNSYMWRADETAIVLSTSGTTGIPKRAELSCNAINALAYQSHYVDLELIPGKTILSPAPPFLAFGISLTIHMPLCNGVCVILSPNPEPNFVVNQFIKYRPNLFLGGPVFLDKIMSHSKVKKMNLSFVKAIEIGGMAVSENYIAELQSFLKEHNSTGTVLTGYGMTELAGCSTSESNSVRRSGSVGIPLCNVNAKVCDINIGIELRYKEVGELYISSPCIMNRYFENDEATELLMEVDKEGTKWVRTGDLAYIDEDGFIYIVGRIKRIEVTIDPITKAMVKLYPDYVEHIINSFDAVERCAVIAVDSTDRERVPVAFVKLKENRVEDIEEMDRYFEENEEMYNKPIKYYFVQEIPILSNGKIDYQSLENVAKG